MKFCILHCKKNLVRLGVGRNWPQRFVSKQATGYNVRKELIKVRPTNPHKMDNNWEEIFPEKFCKKGSQSTREA